MNDDLTHFPKNSLPLIAQKTGVKSRCHAGEQQCTSDLAAKAARCCLEKIDFPPQDVKGIILSTSSPDRMQPATATRVQDLIGAKNAFAFDMNSVCSGSTFGFCIVNSFIRSGQCTNILFIAAELYSKILNRKDFSTFPYFGDGAGAVLFQAGNTDRGVLASILKSDGSGADVIHVPGGGTMMPFDKIPDPQKAFFRMNGKTVYEFAISKGTEIIQQLLEKTGYKTDEIAGFFLHQANINIIGQIAQNLNAPKERFFVNLDRYGNTASASILISLDEAFESRFVREGDLIVAAAFGGGLSWGANLIRL